MSESQKETYKKWKDLVNMSASELKRFMDSDEGKKAGLSRKEAKQLGIHYGRESARWILKMKDTPVSEWTPKMWEWANRQISFNSRMRGNKGKLYDEKGKKTRKHLSLLIWGHNPTKYKDGGEVLLAPNGVVVEKYGDYDIEIKDEYEYIVTALKNGKRVGLLTFLKNPYLSKNGKDLFLIVDRIDVNEKERGFGLATKMYEFSLKHLPKKYKGISSDLKNRVNKKEIPKIYSKFNNRFENWGGYEYHLIEKNKDDTNKGEVLLAPNGKPSNLTPEQYKLVRTPEFKAWFGDWINSPKTASKMLDENGEPLVCYHGSNREFTVFRSDVGSAHDLGFYGRGFYFTFNPESKWAKYAKGEASYYGSIVKDYFIKIVNPFDFRSLSEYKGVHIGYVGTESIVFLSNIAIKYPELSETIKIEQVKWNSKTQENDIHYLPISVLPKLIEKYSKMLKTFETEDNFGEKNKITGYVKSELVEYDYTSSGGKKGSYTSIDTLGRHDIRLKKEEIEILLIVDAIEKYERIEARYQPEGYMTRYPQITDLIKKDHDGIVQSKFGDEVVVFQPTQIKLADGTNTTFDSNNPDIRYDRGGKLKDGGKLIDIIDTKGEPNIINDIIDSIIKIDEIENKLGRKLNSWNDDIVYLDGIKYKKVYLRTEYKRL